jgi:hypothetical protein
MYKIERKHYGLHVTMGGLYSPDEISIYVKEKERLIAEIDGHFSLLIDLRSAIPPDHADETLLQESQAKLKSWGLQRMAIIVKSPIVGTQARQIAISAAVKEQTRIINASKVPDWEEVALDWILYGKEPDSSISSDHQSVTPA